MEVTEFRKIILQEKFDDVLTKVLLSGDAKHVNQEKQDFIKTRVAEKYKVNPEDMRLVIVGSAKLGFSISEKKVKGSATLPRYRPFNAITDIDIAIVSPHIYEQIWDELSRFSFNQSWFPWDSGKLGDYMVCGWLRPDYFPTETRLRKCDDWWDTFRLFSSEQKLGRRRVRGGLFYNFEHLKRYQAKSLIDCIQSEKNIE